MSGFSFMRDLRVLLLCACLLCCELAVYAVAPRIVPEKDIKAALAKSGDKLALPWRYRTRDFCYCSPATAKKALAALQTTDGLPHGAALAVNAATALTVCTQAVSEWKSRASAEYAALQSVKPGNFSVPVRLKNGEVHVLQLIDKLPEAKATLTNRGMVIGQQLLSEDAQKYHRKSTLLKADALARIDTQIVDPGYSKAQQLLDELKHGRSN